MDKVLAYSASALRSRKPVGCYEILLYLSDNEPNVFFAMSLWFSLAELKAILKQPPTLELLDDVKLLEQKLFELIQEYRQLDTKIEASFIRLISHQRPMEITRTLKSTTQAISKAQALPGFIGGWFGLCVSNPHLLLTRADWARQSALETFLEDDAPDSLAKWYFCPGICSEYASYNLQAVVALIP